MGIPLLPKYGGFMILLLSVALAALIINFFLGNAIVSLSVSMLLVSGLVMCSSGEIVSSCMNMIFAMTFIIMVFSSVASLLSGSMSLFILGFFISALVCFLLLIFILMQK